MFRRMPRLRGIPALRGRNAREDRITYVLGKHSLFHAEVNEPRPAAFDGLLAHDGVAHALEERTCGERRVDAYDLLALRRRHGFQLTQDTPRDALALTVLVNVEHVDVARVVQAAESDEVPAFAHADRTLAGKFCGDGVERRAVARRPCVDLLGRVVARGDRTHCFAKQLCRFSDSVSGQGRDVPPKGEGVALPGRATCEVQAESVAFVVSSWLGLDTGDYSFGYVAGWSEGKDLSELRASLDEIRGAAHDIIGGMEQKMAESREAEGLERVRALEHEPDAAGRSLSERAAIARKASARDDRAPRLPDRSDR